MEVQEIDAEQYKALFQSAFARHLAQGVAPTDAAVRALQELQHLKPREETAEAPPPVASAAGVADKAVDVAGTQDVVMKESADVEIETLKMPLEKTVIEEEGGTSGSLQALGAESVTPPPALATKTGMNVVRNGTSAVGVDGKTTEIPLGFQLKQALHQAAESREYLAVKRLVYPVFSDPDVLNSAFVNPTSSGPSEKAEWWDIDRTAVAEVFELLNAAIYDDTLQDHTALQNTLQNALQTLVNQPWNVCSTWNDLASLRFFLVLFEHPSLFDPDYLDIVGGICRLFYHLSDDAKALIREQWNEFYSNDELHRLLDILQQAITVCLYGSRKFDIVYAACSVMKVLHAINSLRDADPFATYDEFYNDAVNAEVDIVQDYTRSIFFLKRRHAARHLPGDDGEHFRIPERMLSELSFCDFPFVLDAGSKAKVMQIDSDLEQRSRAQDAVMSRTVMGLTSPYLVLRIRREHIVEDTMQQIVQMPQDALKKPLKVKFIGEEGIDEGGVQKEFFQILIRQLLDPAFGMFTYDDETRTLWFNADSLEATMEFELIGILLGLAIYNSVILDVHFPHIVYKKLMGCKLDLQDLEKALPALGKGLRQMLEFDGNVEDVFQRNFEYSYEVFGEVKTVELKPGGSSIPVTNANCDEYVSLYVEHVLNASVARQYEAFHRGFRMVCDGEVLPIFRWEELHLLICGSEELDFDALEEATHYDDGFTEDSECIRYGHERVFGDTNPHSVKPVCMDIQKLLDCGSRDVARAQEEAADVRDWQRPSPDPRVVQSDFCYFPQRSRLGSASYCAYMVSVTALLLLLSLSLIVVISNCCC